MINILLQSLMSLMMRNLIKGYLSPLYTIRLGVESGLSLFLVFVNVYVDSVILNLLVLNWRLYNCV